MAKPALRVGGRALLGRVTDALAAAERIVVVGDAEGATRADRVTREDPPGSGPVAGLAAGLHEVVSATVVLAAGDLPFLSADAIRALVAASAGHDAAVAIDDDGRDQLLLAAWRTDRVAARVAALPGSAAVRRVYDGADVVRVRLGGEPPPWWDCDTPEQLARARHWLEATP